MITSIFFRNGHKAPPKSLGHLRLREPRRQPLQKFAQKAPQPTALNPPSTARTAGRSGGCGGACDASPLSCFLFRPRKRLEKRRKRSHTNVFNASVIRTSTSLEQTAHVCFQSRKRVHTRLSERNRTQGHTRRNRGCFGWGWYHYPQSVPHVSETLRGQVSERQTLPLLGLGWVYFRRTQKACGTAMRLCVSLFRGVAAPLGCVIFFRFCRNCGLYTLRETGVVSLPSACSSCC